MNAARGFAKHVPLTPFVALIVDICLFLLMIHNDMSGIGASTRFRIHGDGDRMADYLALTVAIMAILIPVAIELWREQFQSHNLGKKSTLDTEWDKTSRKRYLHGPVISIAIFVGLGTVLPLFIQSSALFWAAVFYGIYLLVYMFLVAFYKKPINIYHVEGLNPPTDKLPTRDIMLDLVTATLENSKAGDGQSKVTTYVWSTQLSEETTAEKMVQWGNAALASSSKVDIERHSFWILFRTFVQRCNIDTLWMAVEAEDAPIASLLKDKRFYNDYNRAQAAQLLRDLVDRFIKDEDRTYHDAVGDVLGMVIATDLDEAKLVQLFGGAFRLLFFKSGEDWDILEAISQDWLVTKDMLSAKIRPPKVRASVRIYLEWVRDLLRYASEPNERAVEQVTEFVFPEVEPIMFAKFVKLWLNAGYVEMTNAKAFSEGVTRWNIFGHIGRVSSEFTPLDEDEETFAKRYATSLKADTERTIEIVKLLGLFPGKSIAQKLLALIPQTDFTESGKKSWTDFANMLLEQNK